MCNIICLSKSAVDELLSCAYTYAMIIMRVAGRHPLKADIHFNEICCSNYKCIYLTTLLI